MVKCFLNLDINLLHCKMERVIILNLNKKGGKTVANIKSQEKRIITSEIARFRNKSIKHEIATAIKKYRASIAEDKLDIAWEELKDIYSMIDSARCEGVYHKNAANNKKSKLTSELNYAHRVKMASNNATTEEN